MLVLANLIAEYADDFEELKTKIEYELRLNQRCIMVLVGKIMYLEEDRDMLLAVFTLIAEYANGFEDVMRGLEDERVRVLNRINKLSFYGQDMGGIMTCVVRSFTKYASVSLVRKDRWIRTHS
mmetsp:Transcript_1284/g.2454  ORF Transcript_1284/g.2454 Transcript_1284/m.2454 type:complete len:123 (-) Transcript_1284:79-447(-)